MIGLLLMLTSGMAEERCYPPNLETEVYCGSLTTADGVSLNIWRLPAIHTAPNPDPLFILAGGPGQAATNLAAIINKRFQRIRTKRDLIFIDQRGTGDSAPIQCDLPKRPFSESYLTDIPLEELNSCAKGIDVSKYLTVKAAKDIELVRQAYGYEQINVYAVSYGTRLALTLLRDYPDGIKRMVLDGVVANQLPLGLHFESDAGRALEKVFSDCESTAECAAAFPALRRRFHDLLNELQTPKSVSVRNPETGRMSRISIDKKGFLLALRNALYSADLASMLPFTIHRATEDDWGPFAAQTGVDISGDLGVGLNLSVICTEDATRLRGASFETDPIFGSLMKESVFKMCSAWPKAVDYKGSFEPISSDLPILVLSGELDPVTPPSSAEVAIESLSKAIHLIAPGAAHNVAMTACAAKEIHAFLDGKSDFEDSCIHRISRPPFFLDHYGTSP